MYSILLYYIILYANLLYSVLLYFIPLHHILFYIHLIYYPLQSTVCDALLKMLYLAWVCSFIALFLAMSLKRSNIFFFSIPLLLLLLSHPTRPVRCLDFHHPLRNQLLSFIPFFLVASLYSFLHVSPSLACLLLSWPLKTHTYTCHLPHRAPSALSTAWKLMAPERCSGPSYITWPAWLRHWGGC